MDEMENAVVEVVEEVAGKYSGTDLALAFGAGALVATGVGFVVKKVISIRNNKAKSEECGSEKVINIECEDTDVEDLD
jgi:hypothetical protein